MKLFILSLFFLPLGLFAKDGEHTFKKVTFSNHQYICFDDSKFLHDPDCTCHTSYIGKIIQDTNSNNSYIFINKGGHSLLDD